MTASVQIFNSYGFLVVSVTSFSVSLLVSYLLLNTRTSSIGSNATYYLEFNYTNFSEGDAYDSMLFNYSCAILQTALENNKMSVLQTISFTSGLVGFILLILSLLGALRIVVLMLGSFLGILILHAASTLESKWERRERLNDLKQDVEDKSGNNCIEEK